jgi:hypothetical protein
MVHQRVIVIALLGWLPLLILSAVQGHLWGKSVAVPFLLDLEVHIRFLIVVPLPIIAELVVHQRLRIDGYAAERTTEPSHRYCVLAKSRLGGRQGQEHEEAT